MIADIYPVFGLYIPQPATLGYVIDRKLGYAKIIQAWQARKGMHPFSSLIWKTSFEEGKKPSFDCTVE